MISKNMPNEGLLLKMTFMNNVLLKSTFQLRLAS